MSSNNQSISPYLEKTLVKKKPIKSRFPAVVGTSSGESKLKKSHEDNEIAYLRKLVHDYETKNANLKKENSALRMKMEAAFNPDNDAVFQLRQAKMKLEAAEGKIVTMRDRIYQIDKAEALVKYWQKQNYEREEELKGTIARYEGMVAEKDRILVEKDNQIGQLNEKLDFAKEKIGILEDKLTKAEDKINLLTKENKELRIQMRDLKKACEQQLIAMKKKCDRDLKIADLKAKKVLKKVAEVAEKKYSEMCAWFESNIETNNKRFAELKAKTDTWYMRRVLYLIEVIDKLKKEASHTYARITAAEDLKQAEIDIDNLEHGLQTEQEEHLKDNLKNEKIIEEKQKIIEKQVRKIAALEKELRETLLAPKEDFERLAAEIQDANDKYQSKCDDLDRTLEILRLVRKKTDEDAEISRYEIKIRDLEIKRLGRIIDDQREEIKRQKLEVEHLNIRMSQWKDECERRHHIILSRIKEIGRLEQVISHVAAKAEDDAIEAANILKNTRKKLRETQEHVKRLQKALEDAIDFGRKQTRKLNIAVQTIREKEHVILLKEKEIVSLEQDVEDANEENLSLEWNLNKRKQLDADKNATIEKQRIEIQELRAGLEAIERKIRTNNAKMTKMRAQVRKAEDRVIRVNQQMEQRETEFEKFREKSEEVQSSLKDAARIQERKLREVIRQKSEEYKEFQKRHLEETKAADMRELRLQDSLDMAMKKRKNANERRRIVEAENMKLVDRLKVAEAEAHAFKLQRLRIEQAEALSKLGRYIGLEAREQTLNNLQRRLNETRDFLERERALTRETVQELAMRNSTLMVQVKNLANSLRGARTEQAELLSNQLMDVSNFSNHLINKLDESALLELKARGRLPPVDSSRYSSRPYSRRSQNTDKSGTGEDAKDDFGLEAGVRNEGSAMQGAQPPPGLARRQSQLERLVERSPYKFEIPRVNYKSKTPSAIKARARRTSLNPMHPVDHFMNEKAQDETKDPEENSGNGQQLGVTDDENVDEAKATFPAEANNQESLDDHPGSNENIR